MAGVANSTAAATARAPAWPELQVFPLSLAEQRLWFLDRLEPGLAIHNVPEALRLNGPLNLAALERGVNEIVRRHAILRTTFAEVDGGPVQIVAPSLKLDIGLDDLSRLPTNERESQALCRISEEASRPFDLQHGPLLRIHVLRLCEDEHVLLINMHHIISDGVWSVILFLRELNVHYNSFAAGQSSALGELDMQYGDYARRQREWIKGGASAALLDYWKTTLLSAPRLLEVPADRPRPPAQTCKGGRETQLLPVSLRSALMALSGKEDVSLRTLLIAAFKALLFRYTRQEDLVIGVRAAGRNWPETRELIGLFANTLGLRTNLSGDPTFRELLARVRHVYSAMQSHDEMPFEMLIDALKPDPSLAYSPLFQVMFEYEDDPREHLDFTGIVASPFEFEMRTSTFDLKLCVQDGQGGTRLTIEHSTDLFDRSTIRRMLGHFEVLLEGVAANPDGRLSRLPLLSPEERHTLVVEWNDTYKEYPTLCVHELFERQVERVPDRLAVTFGSQWLTYHQLNVRANKLAHYLREQGVKPGALVGLYLERSMEMVVALYGVLKSGGAYVPYDTEIPPARLNVMLEDSSPVVLITQSSLLGNLGQCASPIVVIDADWSRIESRPAGNPGVAVGPRDPIYAIYTSGSTGLPKAALNTQAGVANRVVWGQDQYPLTPADRVLQKTPYTFDVSVWEFFWPMVAGAALVIAEPGGHKDPAYLVNVIDRAQITVIHFVPSMLREFLNAENLERCRSLRRVICSGEALPAEIRDAFFGRFRASLCNFYGPTEAAVEVTHWECQRASSRANVPIGRPISNVRIRILDQHLAPVPIGVPGELHIGGVAVASGYLNRPELTEECFIADPFGDEDARLYKTGDLARYLSDGNIEYLGRIDTQVKLHGIRIELEDIETNLLRHPGVRAAAFALREDVSGDRRLVAYIVPSKASLDLHDVRMFLTERLPGYMVPTAYVTLETLPQTASGKLDRRALPAPEIARPKEHQFVGPRTTFETLLTRVWEDVLNVRPIGIRDNYFDLGGHSLQAVRLFSEIKKTFDIELPLATLYHAPTIESLAAVLSEDGRSAPWSSLVPIRRGGSRPPFYCVSGLGGGVLVFRDLAVHLGNDQPIYALQPKRVTGDEAPLTSVYQMAAHYIREIQTTQSRGPYYIGGYSFGGLVAFEMAQQLTNAGHQVAFLALFDTAPPRLVEGSHLKGLYHHSAGSVRVRLFRVLSSRDIAGFIRSKITKRLLWLRERFSRHFRQPPPKELLTLETSQAFAAENYIGRVYRGPVTLFRPQIRPENDPGSNQLAWQMIATGGIEVLDVAGDHLSMFSPDNMRAFASKLRDCLDRAGMPVPH